MVTQSWGTQIQTGPSKGSDPGSKKGLETLLHAAKLNVNLPNKKFRYISTLVAQQENREIVNVEFLSTPMDSLLRE
ncbi:hypothetical protein DSO57_1031888 [Entomophthora muscae]|uniref:Uncharacterized protein n=1 Tax=Entomophthora muscae TaxID=34485 RepID=A0ACC2SDK5_9FUNG|nr:hypothetical protein DSO57_1031888 [Entomophthora muscae]